jgi:DNA recombination-dependent growth factor C
MLFPLQVELIHPEQRLKLLPADVVQDLLQCRMQRLEGCL